nr:hypothetical protein [uncultured bacterium]
MMRFIRQVQRADTVVRQAEKHRPATCESRVNALLQ